VHADADTDSESIDDSNSNGDADVNTYSYANTYCYAHTSRHAHSDAYCHAKSDADTEICANAQDPSHSCAAALDLSPDLTCRSLAQPRNRVIHAGAWTWSVCAGQSLLVKRRQYPRTGRICAFWCW